MKLPFTGSLSLGGGGGLGGVMLRSIPQSTEVRKGIFARDAFIPRNAFMALLRVQ